MARLGIVGFTNSGKTTLFNALTGLQAPTAPHPYTTSEPLPGVARIPDPRLEALAQIEKSAKTVPAVLELLDLPALAPAAEGSGPGGHYLARLREVEGLVVVLRAFTDQQVPSGGETIDPVSQAEELMLELTVADHELLARRAERLTKEATADSGKRSAAQGLAEVVEHLAQGEALRTRSWPEETWELLRDSAPLTLKPAIWVVNVDEDEAGAASMGKAVEAVVPEGDVVVVLSARLEEEAAQLAEADRRELFSGLGLGEGALALMANAAYRSLGVISFYTTGPKESRAWTVRAGAAAPEAAGRIHSDLERGFIRVEVAPIDEVIVAGGWDAAKRQGKARVEGKGYIVQPGDVLVVRFSV
ncbi:MAG TPA: redox-regulated ATPase YchF [Acidimicrobiia bacterium]|nr:redox-regulated ATPase YchF [Acidimicrobiia bacterium]